MVELMKCETDITLLINEHSVYILCNNEIISKNPKKLSILNWQKILVILLNLFLVKIIFYLFL